MKLVCKDTNQELLSESPRFVSVAVPLFLWSFLVFNKSKQPVFFYESTAVSSSFFLVIIHIYSHIVLKPPQLVMTNQPWN